jgi:signal transduction histidine kinase
VEKLSDIDNVQNGAARVRSNKVSLAKIVEDTILIFQDEAKTRNITLTSEMKKIPFFIDADASKIGIVLGNLVKNALQFTNAGGTILIKVEEDSGYMKVSVSDTGIGIPVKDLPRVFERFFQVEGHLTRKYGGMGLGLSVAQSMIELHDGRIWAESEEGKGSIFTFLLPIEKSAKPAAPVSPFAE